MQAHLLEAKCGRATGISWPLGGDRAIRGPMCIKSHRKVGDTWSLVSGDLTLNYCQRSKDESGIYWYKVELGCEINGLSTKNAVHHHAPSVL